MGGGDKGGRANPALLGKTDKLKGSLQVDNMAQSLLLLESDLSY